MKENAIPLTTICARLERAIHADVGMRGLNTLLYGYSVKYKTNLWARHDKREKRFGFAFMTPGELILFSEYAGYDLTSD